jgi:sentrin-specific protease 7
MADAGSLMHLAAQAVYEFARLDQSEVLTFPRGEPDAVTITDRDIESLQPKKFLRDNIIDFYIK